MPRSKRKATAAASNRHDFKKKSAKLGRKARPDNYTHTDVRHRHVFVPDQSRSEQQLTSTQTGLSLPDLLSRTRHHNANTRTAALNALANALRSTHAVAHSAIALSPAPAIHAAAARIADENAPTRAAARNLLVSVWRFLQDVRPFRSIFSTALLACLSHIRLDIRLDGARALVLLVATNRLPAHLMFADTANPLESLCDMLSATNGVKGRTVVLHAICSVCQHGGSCGSSAPNPAPQHRPTANHASSLPFYYHRQRSATQKKRSGRLCANLSAHLASNLIARVANLVTESFPLADTRKDTNKFNMYVSASQALLLLVTGCSPHADHTPVQRCLNLWSAQHSEGHIGAADVNLAGTAIQLGRFHACHHFIVSALKAWSHPAGLERCVENYVENCQENLQVLQLWCNRFEAAAHGGNANVLTRSLPICEYVFKHMSANQTVVRQLFKCLPFAIHTCVRAKGHDGQSDDCANALIRLFSSAYRSLIVVRSNDDELQVTMNNFIDVVCTQRLALQLNQRQVDQIVGVLVAAEDITADKVVSFIGFCYREGLLQLAERFLMGLEAAVACEGEQKYRAVSVVKALKLLKPVPSPRLKAQLERIETTVCHVSV